MKATIPFVTAVVAALVLLSGCASDDGESMSLKERWKLWADRQDAAARDFVATD